MSFCCNINRNGDHGSSTEYLTQTSLMLKRNLQCWISSILVADWMPINPITETIMDQGLLYPLGRITCDLNGKRSHQQFVINLFKFYLRFNLESRSRSTYVYWDRFKSSFFALGSTRTEFHSDQWLSRSSLIYCIQFRSIYRTLVGRVRQ